MCSLTFFISYGIYIISSLRNKFFSWCQMIDLRGLVEMTNIYNITHWKFTIWFLSETYRKLTKKLRPKKKKCVFTVTCQKNLGSVGIIIIFFFYYRHNRKYDSGISFSKFPVSRHLFWSCFMRVTQFFYLLCSQFRQKASGWINKTLLLIKQQKWLSEFCVRIDRVASKN